MATLINVKVAWASPEQQLVLELAVEAGATAREVLRASGIGAKIPGLDIGRCPIGVFGQVVSDDYVLREGDRLEIYRPLEQDPREARRQAAQAGRTLGRWRKE